MRRTLFVTHSTIRNILFAIVAIVVTLFVFLKGGISIDHLKIASFDIEGLYLKLDKKLILRVDKLVIPYTKKKRPLPNIYKDLDRVKEILHFFDYIEFKKINFKNDHYSFLFTDHIFYLTNDMFEIAAHEVNRIDDELQAVIDLVYLKKYDISLSGKLVYDYVNDLALIRGKADYRDIDAEFIIHKRKEDLYYAMKSDTFTQFKPLIDQFDIPPKISVWITDNVRAESYKLLSLKGTIKIDKKGINIVPETIIGRAELKNALVHFRDGLDPYRADKLSIYIEDGKLSFIPENSSFEGHKFQGSLSLDQLIERKAILSLDINFKERLDQEIRKIVEAYKIKVPILQKSGKTDVSLQLDVDLKSKEVEFSGDFTLGKGEVSIGDLLLPVKRGDLHIEHGVATLSGIKLYNSMVDATVDGKVYIKKRYIDLDLDIKNLHLGSDKNSLLAMKKSKLPMKIEYKNSIKISMPTLKTSINISQKNGSAVINMRDLSKIKRSLKNLPLTLDGGNLKIQTDNYKRYTFQGLLKRYDCFIYEKDSACLTQIPIDGYFSKDNLILKAFQDRFVFNSSTSTVKLNHLNLDLKQYFETVDKDQKNRSDSDSGISQKIKVIAKKSTLRYDTHKLLTDRYDLDILPGGDFYFRGTLGSDAVTVRKRKTKLEIRADRIHDKMLHPLINFDGLQRGRYSVMMSGIPKKKMKGVITLDGGVMSNFKAYNNALAFINTIPALATLNSPGFSSRGFKIKRGTIEFTILNNKKLHFDSVLIEGGSATISGDGVIDLDTKKVNIDLAIQAAKPVGQILGSLPVVGYVLAGEKKSIITIGLHISGTLDNPRVKISPIKDTLTLPFKMIQRTLDIPSKLKNKKR